MKRGNQTNSLLVELLIVILFFMLGSAILMQVFGKARALSEKAGVTAEALAEAQNISEQLYAASKPEDVLKNMGFEQEQDGGSQGEAAGEEQIWALPGEYYQLTVKLSGEALSYGVMRHVQVEAIYDGQTLFTLPVSKYADA